MNSILFRDTLLNMLLAMTAAVIITVTYLSEDKSKSESTSTPPGNMIVSIVWPVGDTDVDLWVTGPGEIVPVGYSNKGGLLFNLLRDDLGSYPDASGINYENAYTRGVVPGEYTINVHCYRCHILPQEVKVEVSINTGNPAEKVPLKVLLTSSVKLTGQGQERTAANFTLKEDGTIAPGTLNSVYKPLRDAKKVSR